MPAKKVWIIDDDRSLRWVLERALEQAGLEVTSFSQADEALVQLKQAQPDCLLSDIRMPGMDGLTLLKALQTDYPDLPVLIMTAHSDLDSAVSAYRGGAFEYLPKPFDLDEAVALVNRACQHRSQATMAQQGAPSKVLLPEIIGAAPAMQEVFRAIGRLAKSSITVLINGESGTGKELVAHALHRHSPRAGKPFIALNMAAIPRDLMEAELFGHERGAFTGAQQRRPGRFEQANHGTLFLDEIGDMPLELQTRLLRVLADGEYYSVGGHTPIHADVRIIAATHQDLEQKVRQGLFREDLFHRLNVIRVHIPPLRQRREDIALLLQHFLAQAAIELNVESKSLRPEALEYLTALDWPGNVRQLENTCRWLTVMASGKDVHLEDLPPELRKPASTLLAPAVPSPTAGEDWEQALRRWAEQRLQHTVKEVSPPSTLGIADEVVARVERLLLELAIQHTQGHKQEAARLLGWGRNTLTRKLQEYQLDV